MTYNISKSVVVRMKRYLDDMLEAKRNLTWPSERPDSLAYRIREALAAVQHYDDYTRYHDLRHNFQISAQQGYVEAKWIGIGGVNDPEATEVLAPDRIVLDEIESIQGVVGSAVKMEARADEIYYPNVHPTETEKRVLYDWTKQTRWKFIDQEDEGITLTRRRVDDILIWQPGGTG